MEEKTAEDSSEKLAYSATLELWWKTAFNDLLMWLQVKPKDLNHYYWYSDISEAQMKQISPGMCDGGKCQKLEKLPKSRSN